ncbi:unnamed protein product [Trichogramma brassicae]|uniref:Uncharacterized protein n=1 Tax=Trichogramma brassicae TaxID=86971 RepID=A0A6H5IPP9_9HYME|nr:unnamed protein product [Trichogramma brassicae]
MSSMWILNCDSGLSRVQRFDCVIRNGSFTAYRCATAAIPILLPCMVLDRLLFRFQLVNSRIKFKNFSYLKLK